MNRGAQLPLMPSTVAYNRERDLERRRLPLPDGRTWLHIVAIESLAACARLDDVLCGVRNAPAIKALERAYERLCEISGVPSHEVAQALGITDHRSVAERDRTGDRP